MVEIIATNIISPLGLTSHDNFLAVKAGKSALARTKAIEGVPEEVTVSAFSNEDLQWILVPGFSKFESLAIRSIESALHQTDGSANLSKAVLILSTTKGDIDSINDNEAYSGPADAAGRIAGYFHIGIAPIIVCNACISGSSAQLLAKRLLESGQYDLAIVCGADTASSFTTAGFLSFKALSPCECRPFDMERMGLNLGEAAATMILARPDSNSDNRWKILSGVQTNDAYHLSAPIPDGEGVFRAIDSTLAGFDKDKLGCINVHGTATMFNDQMESKAVERSGLADVPAAALKGYYGHTLGAAGLLEAIITMEAIEEGMIPATRGFSEKGVSGKISISGEARAASQKSFLKIISGFGGGNCAILYSALPSGQSDKRKAGKMEIIHSIRITPDTFITDGKAEEFGEARGKALLAEIYRSHISDYPKFHKMDTLAKLSLLGAEILAKLAPGQEISSAVIFNGTSSIVSDRKHIATISAGDGFYPSPSVFLYTLPNIAVGELAIRLGIKGETDLYILQHKDWKMMENIIPLTVPEGATAIAGWVDCSSEDIFEADLKLVKIS